jgi:hypothetical protein
MIKNTIVKVIHVAGTSSVGYLYNVLTEAVTTQDCEVLEHAVHPSDIFDYLVSKTDMIIFTTLMYGNTPPGKNEWDYYAFTHGQHVFFYNIDTLKYIARKYNLNLISDKKDFHILSKKKIPNIYLYLTKVFYKIGLFSIVKIRIKSKTLDDSNLMKKIE